MRRRILAAAVLVAGLAMSGCSQVSAVIEAATGNPAPVASASASAFESDFTDDGSVTLPIDVADSLEVRIEAWAVDSKQTSEWTASAENTFGMAVNAYDYRVPEKAVLEQKRRVYLSLITITSTLSPSQETGAFQFSADPRTLVPSDTLRSDRGLLLNGYQGGLLIPETVIPPLPADTTGITLEVTLTLAVEGTADDEGSFQELTVQQPLPIAIFADGE